MRTDSTISGRDLIVLVALFASGVAALIYEIAWIRQATTIFGATTFAASSVLAVFFLGIAVGSATFGRIAWRSRRPLRVFAAVEAGVGLLALLTPAGFAAVEPAFGWLYRATSPDDPALFAGRIALVAAILLPPTFFMGATLPLLCREFVRETSRVAAPVGLLYGTNTLGALVGCIACGLWLLPAFGLAGSIRIGAGLNIAAALGVLATTWFTAVGDPVRDRLEAENPDRKPLSRGAADEVPSRAAPGRLTTRRAISTLFVLVFASGFVAIGGQVLWIRFLALLVPNGVHTYMLTLAAVLVGIVAGSALAARLADSARHPVPAFAVLQIGHGLLVMGALHLPVAWLRGLSGDPGSIDSGGEVRFLAQFLPCLLLVPPAIASGASFPLAVRLCTASARQASRRVGMLTAVNTLGGIAGSLALGFWLLPSIGLERAVTAVTGISVAIGLVAWLWLTPRDAPPRGAEWAVAAVAVALWLLTPRLLGTSIPFDHLVDPGDELVAVREGLVGNVAVIRRDGALSLEIDRWWQGQRAAHHQRLAAHLPMLLHADPRRVLVVGVGAGQTPSRFLFYDIEQLDCVEIEPAVLEVVRGHFGGGAPAQAVGEVGDGWMDDPRVRLLAEDGRSFLSHSETRYDVISLELGQVFRPSVASFYHVDLYARIRARLAPGGIVSQFVPISFFEPIELRRAIASFVSIFPESFLWYNTSELLLIGLADGADRIDPDRFARELARPTIQTDLDFSHWGGSERALARVEVLIGGLLLGPLELGRLAAGVAPFRDDRPELEYRASARSLDPARELENARLIGANLAPPSALPPTLQTLARTSAASGDVGAIQSLNAGALVADAQLRRVGSLAADGRIDELERLLRAAHAQNPEHATLNRTLGELSLLRDHLEQAIGFFDVATRARPVDALARKGKAVALHRSGRVREAIRSYRDALDERPDDVELLNGLGSAQAERNNFHAARVLFERAVALDPDYAEARRNLDRLNRVEGR